MESRNADSSNSRMKDILTKVEKEVEKTEDYLKEFWEDILRMIYKVESHTIVIQHLEQHFGQMSIVLNQHRQDNFWVTSSKI